MNPRLKVGFELEAAVRTSAKHRTTRLRDSWSGSYHNSIEQEYDGPFSHGLKSIDDRIIIGVDGSVECRDGFDDTEIRLPALDWDEGIKLFEEVLCFCQLAGKAHSFYTNESCGLHVNVSEHTIMPSNPREFYAHVLYNFPEERILKLFGREENDYCTPTWLKHIRRGSSKRDLIAAVVESGRNYDLYEGDDKYRACAFRNNGQRIEFRCLGNRAYHTRMPALQRALDTIHLSFMKAFDELAGEEPKQRLPVAA